MTGHERRSGFGSGIIPAMRSLFPSAADSICKPTRQFANSIGLSAPDRFPGDQLSAYAKRNCARQNEVERIQLIHASRCNQRHVWEHGLQGTNVAVTTNVPRSEEHTSELQSLRHLV